MGQDWTLADINLKYRDITGLKSTSQQNKTQADNAINDYYQNRFPVESKLERFKGDFVQSMDVSDDGDFAIAAGFLDLLPPYDIDGFDATLYQDHDRFDLAFPEMTGVVNLSDPGLAIGSSSEAAVANNAFSYRLDPYSYSKAADETALSGETLPQDKYGAWRLEIGPDKTISIVEADNATGYDSAGQAVQALTVESSTNVCMGFVTVINTNAAFVPGTTLLTATGVTATYTDGYHSIRGIPYAVLIDEQRIWFGPKPDDIHVFKCRAIIRPAALSADNAVPLDLAWGIAIAYGAAAERKSEDDDEEALARIFEAKEHFLNLLRRPDLIQGSTKRASPRF